MKKKKPIKWTTVLLNLLFVIPSLFNVISHAISCVEEDMRLAGKSIIALIILSMLSVVFLLGTWFCLCAMAFLWLLSWPMSAIASLGILLAAHLILILMISLMILNAKDKLLFHQTRDLFHP